MGALQMRTNMYRKSLFQGSVSFGGRYYVPILAGVFRLFQYEVQIAQRRLLHDTLRFSNIGLSLIYLTESPTRFGIFPGGGRLVAVWQVLTGIWLMYLTWAVTLNITLGAHWWA